MSAATAMAIVKGLEVLSLALTAGPQAYAAAQASIAKLKVMVAEGRDPTEAENAELDSELAALRSVLHKPI